MSIFFSIIIPNFNSSKTIYETVNSIVSQSYKNFELIIQDDFSTDNSLEIIKKFNDPRIKIFKNSKNLGYGPNLELGRKNASYEYIIICGNDDILRSDLLESYSKIYINSNIGAIVRPFYEYIEKNKPVRFRSYNIEKTYDEIGLTDDHFKISQIFYLAGNLSGVSFQNSLIEKGINKDIWPAHIYPLCEVLLKKKVAVHNIFCVAVKLDSNQSTKSFAFIESPSIQWIRMFNLFFNNKNHIKLFNYLKRNFVAKNYIGLVQIKNFGSTNKFIFESLFYIKLNPRILLDLKFYFYFFSILIIPRFLLRKIVINVKKFNSKIIINDKKLLKKLLFDEK